MGNREILQRTQKSLEYPEFPKYLAVRSHIALLFIQFMVLSLFKHYVLGGEYRNAQLKTLRTYVSGAFEDESSDERGVLQGDGRVQK